MKIMPVALPLLLACNSPTDIDTAGLKPISSVDSLDYSRIQPSQSYEYWELRCS
ncbi:MAG: hypothetical protein ACT4O1_16725 [Gemmatimonadota bacterium]